jgi:spermidine synthase
MQLLIGDGGDFIRQQAFRKKTTYDLLILDAFDHSAMADSVQGKVFFNKCKEIMSFNGIMVINLWGSQRAAFQENSNNLLRVFEERVCFLPVKGRANVIAFCFSPHYPQLSQKKMREQTLFLECSYNVEMPLFLKALIQHNPKTIKHLLHKK